MLRKTTWILGLLGLLGLGGAACQKKWDKAEENCVEAAVSSGRGVVTRPIAEKYCACVLAAAKDRWSVDEFEKNELDYTQKLVDDGTLARCLEAAR